MTSVELFGWGCLGCFSVDVVTFAKCFEHENGKVIISDRYKHIVYYIIRFLMMLVAGGLAVAYEIDKPILAVNIGAATPLIVQTFYKSMPQ